MKINNDLYKTVVLTILAGIAATTVALANRDVYSKSEADATANILHGEVTALQDLEALRHVMLDTNIQEMKTDIRWVVQHLGGQSVQTTEDSNSP